MTQHVLSKFFSTVDLVDQSPKFVATGQKLLAGKPYIGQWYTSGIQDFVFEHTYDCIWVQWVACYLTDADLIDFLKRSVKVRPCSA